MHRTRRELVYRFIEQMERIHRYLGQTAVSQELADLELTLAQLRTLGLLVQGPQRMTDLAGSLGNGLSSTTSMIDRLVHKGLVERLADPSDRRIVLCQLTGRGHAEMEQFWHVSRWRIEPLAHTLTDDELIRVVSAMDVVLQATAPAGDHAPRWETHLDEHAHYAGTASV